jgi:hypothetical protein
MKKAKIISAVVMSGLLSIATAHASSIKIGFNVPLTGFAAADGTSALNGAELAVEQANATGGVNGENIVLVVYDDQASPKEAVPIAPFLAAILAQLVLLREFFRKQAYPTLPPTRFIQILLARETTFSELRLWVKCRDVPAPN